MKKALAIIAGLTAYALVSAAPNICVVNMAKVYQNFYKAKTAMAQIESSRNQAQQEIQQMAAKREELAKPLAAIQEKMKNPALSEDARRKIYETEAQPILVEVNKQEQKIRDFNAQASKRLQDNVNNVRQVHIQEILEVLKTVAADKKADIVLEHTAAPFSKPQFDITEDLIKAINANAPAAASVPSKK